MMERSKSYHGYSISSGAQYVTPPQLNWMTKSENMPRFGSGK
jgi:hypothetical protein